MNAIIVLIEPAQVHRPEEDIPGPPGVGLEADGQHSGVVVTSARTREGEIAEFQEAISGLLERAPQ